MTTNLVNVYIKYLLIFSNYPISFILWLIVLRQNFGTNKNDYDHCCQSTTTRVADYTVL